MGKCICCNTDIEQERIFGVVKSTHYDSRTTTADMDLGTYTYDPVALIKIGVCKACAKKLFQNAFKQALKLLGIGVLVSIIGASVASGDDVPETARNIFACAVIIGFILMIRGIGGIINSFIQKGNGKIALFGITDTLKGEWMIVPDNAEDYSVKEQERSLTSRYSWRFFYVDEKKLQKPLKAKYGAYSKDRAINTLKTYYSEKMDAWYK